jgi:hypothetical protein
MEVHLNIGNGTVILKLKTLFFFFGLVFKMIFLKVERNIVLIVF